MRTLPDQRMRGLLNETRRAAQHLEEREWAQRGAFPLQRATIARHIDA